MHVKNCFSARGLFTIISENVYSPKYTIKEQEILLLCLAPSTKETKGYTSHQHIDLNQVKRKNKIYLKLL